MTTKRSALNVSLTRELASYVAAQVASGRYGTASEVVREALRLLQDKATAPPASPEAPRKTPNG